MKKVWTLTAVCLLSALLLASCRDSGVSTNDGVPSKESEKTPSETVLAEESPAPEDIEGSRGLEYRLEGDSYVLVGIGYCELSDIVIPAYYQGKPVSRINKTAFRNCNQLKTVTIVNGVTKIGEAAFYGCRSLYRVVIPDSVTEIERSAFLECSSLHELTLGNGVQIIGDSAFSFCRSLENFVLPQSVTTVGNRAFYGSCMESVVVSKNVMSMGERAFESFEVYCELERTPEGWNDNWMGASEVVYWAGSWEYVDGVPTKK